jgi:HK97 family phage major capsid protein
MKTEEFFRIRELRQKLDDLNNLAKKEKRNFKPEEQRQWDMLMSEYREIANQKVFNQLDTISRGNKPSNSDFGFNRTGYKTEHRSIGEFIRDVRFPELHKRDMVFSTGVSGGYLVPDQFLGSVITAAEEKSIVRSRATVLPADSERPDAPIGIPALDYDEGGYQGGVSVHWLDEGDELEETTPKLQLITLGPHQVGAHTIVTNKLLRNDAGAAETFLNKIFREVLFEEEDYQFLTGDGAGKPEGILNSPATVEVSRNTATSFKWADVANMMGKFRFDGWSRSLWVINASLMPDVITMADDGNNRIFTGGNPTEGIPGNLLGIPVVFSSKTPTAGNKGDVMLLDLSYYLVKQGSGPLIMASEHPLIKQDKTVIVFHNFVDGASWLKAPLPARDGNTYSPFVVLK